MILLGHEFIEFKAIMAYKDYRCKICNAHIYSRTIDIDRYIDIDTGKMLDTTCDEMIIKNLLE